MSAYSDAPTLVNRSPPRRVARMAEESEPVIGEQRERRVSYGIGGAGNIRRPCFAIAICIYMLVADYATDRSSDIKVAQEIAADTTANAESEI